MIKKCLHITLFFLFCISSNIVAQVNKGVDENCAQMQIVLAGPVLKMDNPNNYYTVLFCNTGNADAANAFVEIDLDPYLTLISSEIPISKQTNNSYSFDLGTVNAATCGGFKIQVSIRNNTPVNQEHCTVARIYPTEACTSSNTQTNTSFGNNDSDHSGRGVLPDPTGGFTISQFIFEDNVMLNQTPITFDSIQLMANNQNNDISTVIADIEKNQIDHAIAAMQQHNNEAILESVDCRFNIGYNAASTQQVLSTPSSTETMNQTIQVFPNPMQENATLEVIHSTHSTFSVKLMDVAGRAIKHYHVDNRSKLQINRENLGAGIYIYQVEAGGQLLGTGKLVIR